MKAKAAFSRTFLRAAICFGVIALGFLGMQVLSAMKRPPAAITPREPELAVATQAVAYEDVQVTLSGFGTALASRRVTVSAEVPGLVTHAHPRLDDGEIIAEGEILFTVDRRDYRAAVADAQANRNALAAQKAQLETSHEIDQQRLSTLQRNRELARRDFERLRDLFTAQGIGSQTSVDASERAYNQAADAVQILEQTLSLFPWRMQESTSALARADAALEKARTDLERCTIRAPFDARLDEVAVEAGQYLTPGMAALRLMDDFTLEIQVPLGAREARQWIRFVAAESVSTPTAWFDAVAPSPCRITWTESADGAAWTGTLHRIVGVAPRTRTVIAAVRIGAEAARAIDGRPPLVDGMFCRVDIPGRTLRRVVRLPRWAVTLENTVYVSREDRLRTVPVDVARMEGDTAYISGGLAPGERVITTRLIDPLEGIRLRSRSDTPVPPDAS